MKENRKYERQLIDDSGDQRSKIDLIVGGETARLVNFSLGGMYIVSKKFLSVGEIVNLSIIPASKERIDLMGVVVRIKRESDNQRWGIAIDLSKACNQKLSNKRI